MHACQFDIFSGYFSYLLEGLVDPYYEKTCFLSYHLPSSYPKDTVDLIAMICRSKSGDLCVESYCLYTIYYYILCTIHLLMWLHSTNCTWQQLPNSLTAACVHMWYFSCVALMNVTTYDRKTQSAAFISVKTQFCKQVSLSLNLPLFRL